MIPLRILMSCKKIHIKFIYIYIHTRTRICIYIAKLGQNVASGLWGSKHVGSGTIVWASKNVGSGTIVWGV